MKRIGRAPKNLKIILSIATLALACFANAGSYTLVYSGGKTDWDDGSGPDSTPYSYSSVTNRYGGIRNANTVNCNGKIQASFTWVPDYVGEPQPPVVMIRELCDVEYTAIIGTGSCSTDMPVVNGASDDKWSIRYSIVTNS